MICPKCGEQITICSNNRNGFCECFDKHTLDLECNEECDGYTE